MAAKALIPRSFAEPLQGIEDFFCLSILWLINNLSLLLDIEPARRYFKIDEKELTSRTRRRQIAEARAVIGHIATQELSIAGSEVAFTLNVDRSAIIRAV